MTSSRRHIINLLVFFVIFFLGGTAQATWWPYIFGSIPSPQIWLIVLVHLILYRPLIWAFILVYSAGLILTAFTAMPLGILLLSLGEMTALISYVKSRFFWSNTRYFVIACVSAHLAFQIFYLSNSWMLETNPSTWKLIHRLFENILTGALAVPLFWLLKWIDQWTLGDVLLTLNTGDSQ